MSQSVSADRALACGFAFARRSASQRGLTAITPPVSYSCRSLTSTQIPLLGIGGDTNGVFGEGGRFAIGWPDPRSMVDTSWAVEDHGLVVGHLRAGRVAIQFRGLSPCRFCGRGSGSKELSDGRVSWPEGLHHYLDYLDDHDVRRPGEFVDHVAASDRAWLALPTPSFDHLGQRDRFWPAPNLEHVLPGEAMDQHDDDTPSETSAGGWPGHEDDPLALTPEMSCTASRRRTRWLVCPCAFGIPPADSATSRPPAPAPCATRPPNSWT